MLADRRHAASMQAATERRSEHRYRVRLTMECAIADDGAHAKIEIEHRSEAEIDAACGELICDHLAPLLAFSERSGPIRIVKVAQCAHRGNNREFIAKPLHASTLMVDANHERRRSYRANLARQGRELCTRRVIAREENHAANQWMRKSVAIG